MTSETPNRRLILCVEDNHDTCEMIKVVLSAFEVKTAHSVREAIDQLDQNRFSLILLDYHLNDAEGDGLFLCRYIRRRDPETPVYFTSASINLTDDEAHRVGAQGLIPKGPNFVDQLLEKAGEILAVHRSAGSAYDWRGL